MPGPILHLGARGACTHGGQLSLLTTQGRVRVGGQPVYTADDPSVIAACAFVRGVPSSPCVRVRWLAPSSRVRVLGRPVVLRDSAGLTVAIDEVPQGTPVISACQVRVRAR